MPPFIYKQKTYLQILNSHITTVLMTRSELLDVSLLLPSFKWEYANTKGYDDRRDSGLRQKKKGEK